MLVLKRNQNEVIVIDTSDGEIRLMITEADGPVEVGIDAPKACTILREELIKVKRHYWTHLNKRWNELEVDK